MDLFETILKRHSVRAYLEKPVEEEKLQKIMGAGLHSASARHRQPYKVYVVKNKELRTAVVKANFAGNFWLKEAPVIMVICIISGEQNDNKYPHIDSGIIISNMMLAATALGLGSCACGAFDGVKIKKALDLPENITPIICLPIGYPRVERKGMVDLPKDYEKLAHLLLHYKERKVSDIFTIKE
ncbi:MAG: nitroreductase family protein [Patescibacteria group bacterium]